MSCRCFVLLALSYTAFKFTQPTFISVSLSIVLFSFECPNVILVHKLRYTISLATFPSNNIETINIIKTNRGLFPSFASATRNYFEF